MRGGGGVFGELKRRNVIRMAGLYVAVGWLVVEVAGTVLPMFDAPEWIARSLVVVIAIGFVPAVLFAWVFEVTPDGIKREDEIPAEASITHHTARRMDIALIAVVVALVGYIGIDKLMLAPKRDAAMVAATEAKAASRPAAIPDKSIAVLPFRNEGGNADDLYFSDGLSEDLITALSKFDGLKVIARDSAFQFRDSKEGSKAIASQLGVAHLLSGSVRRLGGVVRIRATLVNASDGSSLWSQRYDRPYKDLFALQDDITAAVSGALQAKLSVHPEAKQQSDRPPSGNLDAYEAMLLGNFNFAKRTKEATQAAVKAYGQAIALDPAYAFAHARRARALAILMGKFGVVTPEGAARARQDVNAALRLAPDSTEALNAKSYLLRAIDSDLPAALRASQRAVKLAPQNVASLIGLAAIQRSLGQSEAAIAGYQRVLLLDPLSDVARYNLATVLIAAGNYADAEAELRIVIRQQPEAASNHTVLAIAQLLQGRTGEAVATAKQEPDAYWRTFALALAYWGNGDHANSDEALQTLIRENPDDGSSQIATIYAQRRQPDEMFKWLAHAKARNQAGLMNDAGVTELRTRKFIAHYSDDPRYIALVRELGLMAEDGGSPTVAAGNGS